MYIFVWTVSAEIEGNNDIQPQPHLPHAVRCRPCVQRQHARHTSLSGGAFSLSGTPFCHHDERPPSSERLHCWNATSVKDHPVEMPPWWKTTPLKCHPDERPPCWNATPMKDHPDEMPPWWKTTLLKCHPDERPLCWNATLMKDHSVEMPPWWKTTLLKCHPDVHCFCLFSTTRPSLLDYGIASDICQELPHHVMSTFFSTAQPPLLHCIVVFSQQLGHPYLTVAFFATFFIAASCVCTLGFFLSTTQPSLLDYGIASDICQGLPHHVYVNFFLYITTLFICFWCCFRHSSRVNSSCFCELFSLQHNPLYLTMALLQTFVKGYLIILMCITFLSTAQPSLLDCHIVSDICQGLPHHVCSSPPGHRCWGRIRSSFQCKSCTSCT